VLTKLIVFPENFSKLEKFYWKRAILGNPEKLLNFRLDFWFFEKLRNVADLEYVNKLLILIAVYL